MLPSGFPKRTLGWQVLDWCSAKLLQPDDHPTEDIKGTQWKFKPDQAMFLLWFYAVDERGKFIYRRAYRERAKGTGKSPMVAAIACAEFLGPVKFSHFDEKGQAVGKRNNDSHIQLAAVSEKQCKSTYAFIMEMLSGCAREYGIEIGMTKVQLIGGGTDRVIEMVTANHRSQEGFRPSFAIFEETQHWLPSEKGPEFAQTVRRNLRKKGGRDIEVTNAPEPGLGTVAELTHQYQKLIEDGLAKNDGLLFDTFSIHVDDIYDPEQAMPALKIMYKDAPWIDLDDTFGQICDPSEREVDARRFYFNEIVPPTAMWLTEAEWDGAGQKKLVLNKRDKIALGFRIRKHCAAIVATRLSDSATFLMKMWERPAAEAARDWEVPYADVDKYMRKLLGQWNVVYCMTSPNGFADVIGRWAQDFQEDVIFEAIWLDRNKQKHSDAVEVFENAVRDQRLKHTGDPDLKRHIMNAFLDDVPPRRLIRMETYHSKRFIVAAEAALLSFQGSMEAIAEGCLDDAPDKFVFSFN